MRKAGNRVRITGQLIDTATGAHIWADRFDGALDDIFELQDQVASSVVGAIEPKLRSSEIERAIRKPTESLDAYDLIPARSRGVHVNGHPESIARGDRLFRRALAIDPSYAPAAAYVRLVPRSTNDEPVECRPLETEAAEGVRLASRAIEAGKEDPDALWMGGCVMIVFAGERDRPERDRPRVALNPNSALRLVRIRMGARLL